LVLAKLLNFGPTSAGGVRPSLGGASQLRRSEWRKLLEVKEPSKTPLGPLPLPLLV
jgi:hypothetical protein